LLGLSKIFGAQIAAILLKFQICDLNTKGMHFDDFEAGSSVTPQSASNRLLAPEVARSCNYTHTIMASPSSPVPVQNVPPPPFHIPTPTEIQNFRDFQRMLDCPQSNQGIGFNAALLIELFVGLWFVSWIAELVLSRKWKVFRHANVQTRCVSLANQTFGFLMQKNNFTDQLWRPNDAQDSHPSHFVFFLLTLERCRPLRARRCSF
jgi:hypothetical protein